MTIDLKTLTISSVKEMFANKTLTSVELVQAYLDQIKAKDKDINAFREVYADAIEQAKKADELRSNADAKTLETLSLLGIPFSIKDNILIEGRIVGASSKILENYTGSYDSTVVRKLKEVGAIFIGRLNMDEFAMGGSTENSAYGVTKNPNDLTRVAGGSSGGSAASVAMNAALVSLGSDTGGSIRQPASYCGVVGLKPTYGRVSRHGLMAMGSSLDVIGPIAKTVEETEQIFNVISGGDRYDSTSLSDVDVNKAKENSSKINLNKLRVGIVPELMNMGGINPAVLQNLNESVEKLKAAGVEIKEVSLPHIKYSLAVYYILMPAEVSSNMARFDSIKYGGVVEGKDLLGNYLNTRGELLGKEVRRRIILGTYVLSSGYHDAYYNKANIVRNLISDDFKKAFEEVDVILTPTAPSPAFKIGQNTSDPIAMYLEDVFTVTANLIGVPAISIPSGAVELDEVNTEGEKIKLPLGIQFTAPLCREDVLFAIGKKFEEIR
jgi:aspartyl-tRNA(Asn)/glutamyl-tRNA(Gln) amidotransferase subunit A